VKGALGSEGEKRYAIELSRNRTLARADRHRAADAGVHRSLYGAAYAQ
jgi:hypothetical protein